MAGLVKIFNGSAWVAKPIKLWTGAAWVQKSMRHWDGSQWMPSATPPPPAVYRQYAIFLRGF